MILSRIVRDANGAEYTLSVETPFGIPAARRQLDAMAERFERSCPSCGVDLGVEHEPDCEIGGVT